MVGHLLVARRPALRLPQAVSLTPRPRPASKSSSAHLACRASRSVSSSDCILPTAACTAAWNCLARRSPSCFRCSLQAGSQIGECVGVVCSGRIGTVQDSQSGRPDSWQVECTAQHST
jgi:hypothetical protein